MCGRYAQRTDAKRLAKEFKVAEVKARYNIAPTQEVLAVRESPDGREATFFKWGLVPSWAKDASIGAKLINARSETVEEKPSFRDAFKNGGALSPPTPFMNGPAAGEAVSSRTSSGCATTAPSASPGSSRGGSAAGR